MKAFLMHGTSDFDAEAELPPNAEALIAGPGAGHAACDDGER